MGYWHTVHFFDYKNFEKNVFHDLNNKNEFRAICQKFMELTPYLENGRSLPYEEKIGKIDSLYNRFEIITKKFRKDFSLKELNGNEDEKEKKAYLNSIFDYHFARFFNFLLFFKYANYCPFVIGGKHGISTKFEGNDSLGCELLTKLDPGLSNNYFSLECQGIVGWLTIEEVSLLEMDLNKLIPCNKSYTIGFFNLVKIAKKENLGIILGVDMLDDRIYNELPKKNMINFKDFDESEIEGLCFEK